MIFGNLNFFIINGFNYFYYIYVGNLWWNLFSRTSWVPLRVKQTEKGVIEIVSSIIDAFITY